MKTLQRFWRKNGGELLGLFNGALPAFVRSIHPRLSPGRLPVFCYHLVDPALFAADMDFLARNHYRTLSGHDLLAVLRGETPPGERDLVLTFDDGPLNTFQVAHPLLQQSGFSALLFVCPGLLRREETSREPRLCGWRELRQLHDSGCWDIQCHTWAHRSIPRWPEPVPLTGVDPRRLPQPTPDCPTLPEDLARAKQRLEQELQKPIQHLAWPEYQSTPAARQQAADAGFEYGWGGLQAGHALLSPPASTARDIPRLSGEFLRRLPGRSRRSLFSIAAARVAAKRNPPAFGIPESPDDLRRNHLTDSG